MTSEPRIEVRPERSYVGVRAVMPMSDFGREIPAMTETVADWLEAKGLRASGAPFLRYHIVDMPHRMDVELGMPIDTPPVTDGQVRNGVLPAGSYAVLSYTGVANGVPANERLLKWIAERGEQVQLIKRRTDWYLLRTGQGQQGWVAEEQMGDSLRSAGIGPTRFALEKKRRAAARNKDQKAE